MSITYRNGSHKLSTYIKSDWLLCWHLIFTSHAGTRSWNFSLTKAAIDSTWDIVAWRKVITKKWKRIMTTQEHPLLNQWMWISLKLWTKSFSSQRHGAVVFISLKFPSECSWWWKFLKLKTLYQTISGVLWPALRPRKDPIKQASWQASPPRELL